MTVILYYFQPILTVHRFIADTKKLSKNRRLMASEKEWIVAGLSEGLSSNTKPRTREGHFLLVIWEKNRSLIMKRPCNTSAAIFDKAGVLSVTGQRRCNVLNGITKHIKPIARPF